MQMETERDKGQKKWIFEIRMTLLRGRQSGLVAVWTRLESARDTSFACERRLAARALIN